MCGSAVQTELFGLGVSTAVYVARIRPAESVSVSWSLTISRCTAAFRTAYVGTTGTAAVDGFAVTHPTAVCVVASVIANECSFSTR